MPTFSWRGWSYLVQSVCTRHQHYGMACKAKATCSRSISLEPRKTLNWGSLFCTVLSPFVQYTRMGPSH